MTDQREDKINFGTTLFFVLFFLFISAISNNSTHNLNDSSPDKVSLSIETHSGHSSAIIVEPIILPNLQKCCFFIRNNTPFSLFSKKHKISVDNIKIAHRYYRLQKNQPSILPSKIIRSHIYHVFADDDEIPILS